MTLSMKAVAALFAAFISAATLVFTAPAKADETTQLAAKDTYKVTLSAALNGDAKQAKNVTFTIKALGESKDPPKTLTGPGSVDLVAGRYSITTTLQQLTVTEQVDVKGPVTYTAALKAGKATLAMITKIGGKPVKDEITWRVLTWKKDSKGNRQLITTVIGAQQMLLLPQGWYLLEANRNGKITKHTIEISNGRTYDYTLLEQ